MFNPITQMHAVVVIQKTLFLDLTSMDFFLLIFPKGRGYYPVITFITKNLQHHSQFTPYTLHKA